MTAEVVNAASMAFKKALIARALGAELNHHLGYAAGETKPAQADTAGPHRGDGQRLVALQEQPLERRGAHACRRAQTQRSQSDDREI
jgi:putative transposase